MIFQCEKCNAFVQRHSEQLVAQVSSLPRKDSLFWKPNVAFADKLLHGFLFVVLEGRMTD